MTPEQFSSFARVLPDSLCLIDATGRMLATNSAAERLFGQDSRTLNGMMLLDLIVDENGKFMRTLRTWSASRDMTPGALRVRTDSEGVISCHGYGNLIQSRTEDTPSLIMLRVVRRVKFTLSFSALNEKIAQLQQEVRERRNTEIELANSKAHFEAMFNAIPDAVMFADTERRMLMNNPAVHVMFGYSDEELIGQTTEMLYADKCGFVEQGKRRFNSGAVPKISAYEVQYQRKDGSSFWAETMGTQVRNHEGEVIGFIGLHRDITDRKKVGNALLESQRMLRLVLDSIPVRVFWKDRDCIYLGCNQHLAKDAGVESPDQIIGKTDFELSWKQQAELYRADDQRVMESGIAYLNYEEHQVRPGGTQRLLQTSKIPLCHQDGKVFGVMGIYDDITERRQAEEAARHSQKLEAVGQLSGGIAHDFNNQLGVIIGYLDFLKNHFTEGEKPLQWVETATRASLRCMDLTRQLLAFSRRQSSEKKVVDLNESLKELVTMIARSVTPEVELLYTLVEDIWLVEIDPGEFQDMILNLVINARDAMPYGGKLLIETGNRHLDANYSTLNPGLESGDYVQLMLSDSGTGIEKEVLEHIFEPFFTTKPEGKGTGLGMAMVYGFVKRNGGYIKIYSEPGVGTTIRIYLPRSEAASVARSAGDREVGELPGGKESVLIVDDEADLLVLADRYLTELGYRTRLADNASQALDILAEDRKFDLLFSDVVMPGGMNGYELAQQATELIPELKVLLTSGFTAKTIAHKDQARFAAHLLGKPYRKDGLARQVRVVLDEQLDVLSNACSKNKYLNGHTILVIDDEEDIRELFRLNLQRLGCRCVLASSGDEAFSLYQESLESEESISIVILDLNLNGSMDGKEVAEKIRSIDQDARIIVSSGHTSGPEMTQYKDYGFNGALEKSFDREKIREVLEQVMRPG